MCLPSTNEYHLTLSYSLYHFLSIWHKSKDGYFASTPWF
jgi:hypothetical protein